MKKYRGLRIFILVFIVLPACTLVVIGLSASGTTLCQTCLQANHQVLDLPFSELMLSPEKYTDQLIRVEAIFENDAGETFLQDGINTDWKKKLPVGFGKNYMACAATQKALAFHTGLETWYDGATRVTVIGKYGGIDDQRNFHTGQTGFTLLCFERVKPADTTAISINTIRYSMGRLMNVFFHP